MNVKIQIQPDFVFLFDEDNKVIRSERKPSSGDTIIAIAKLRTFAKRNGFQVVK